MWPISPKLLLSHARWHSCPGTPPSRWEDGHQGNAPFSFSRHTQYTPHLSTTSLTCLNVQDAAIWNKTSSRLATKRSHCLVRAFFKKKSGGLWKRTGMKTHLLKSPDCLRITPLGAAMCSSIQEQWKMQRDQSQCAVSRATQSVAWLTVGITKRISLLCQMFFDQLLKNYWESHPPACFFCWPIALAIK